MLKYHVACRRRQNAEYRALGPGGGGFNAAAFDDVNHYSLSLTRTGHKSVSFVCLLKVQACQQLRADLRVASHARACAQVLARLVLDHPGVRHRCVADAAEAADHVSQLTKALATQPFKVQVRFQANLSRRSASASLTPRCLIAQMGECIQRRKLQDFY